LRIGGDILKVTIRTSDPEVKLVFLSAYVNDQCIDQALELEAQGYLSKQDPVEVVFDAVRGAYHGGTRYSKSVRDRIVLDACGVR